MLRISFWHVKRQLMCLVRRRSRSAAPCRAVAERKESNKRVLICFARSIASVTRMNVAVWATVHAAVRFPVSRRCP
jgi:hypothetical protein